jgi:PKD repeat protein
LAKSNSHEIKEIKVTPDLNIVTGDTLVCEHGEVKLSAISSGNMLDCLWDWGDGTSDHQQKDATHIYHSKGEYNVHLTATFDNKCSNSIRKEHYIDVKSIPAVGFSIKENQCLDTGSQTLYAMVSGDEISRYDWDLSGLTAEEIIQPPGNSPGPLLFRLINHPSGRIALQVVSRYGCISENKSLNVKRKPIFTIDSDVKEGCTPLTVRFKAKTGDPVDQVDYLWDLGKEGTFSGDEIVHTYLQPNQYYNLSVKAISKITGCSDFIDQKNFILAHPNPKAGYAVTPEYTYNDQGEVNFLDQSQDAVRYNWDFGDGSGSDEKNPVHKYNIVGIQIINQTVYNQYGCSDKAAKLYVVALSKLYPPTAFSTNALNPVDREFKLFSNGIKVEGYHLKILSRWNDVVFECNNEIKGWNGRMLNGEIAPSGNYIWILEFTDFVGKFHRQSGTVMLVN